MALSISTDDIGKDLILVHTEDTKVEYYLAKLTLVKGKDNSGTFTTEKGYFSTPAEGNKILDDGDTAWEYSVLS